MVCFIFTLRQSVHITGASSSGRARNASSRRCRCRLVREGNVCFLGRFRLTEWAEKEESRLRSRRVDDESFWCPFVVQSWFMTTSRYPIIFVAVLVIALVVPVLVVPSSSPYKTAADFISPGTVKGVLTCAQTFATLLGKHLLEPVLPALMGSKPSTPAMPQQSVHEFTVKDASGNEVDLSTYKGKVLLIVNVASQCGLTNSNYKELTEVYTKYKDQGLEILAFPCNQFGGQEPGTNEEIKNFACTKYKTEFPIFDKVNVNGENADPLYKFLKSSKGGGILGESIKWNFSKFLVDKDGKVVDRYAPTTSPLKIEKDIKKLL